MTTACHDNIACIVSLFPGTSISHLLLGAKLFELEIKLFCVYTVPNGMRSWSFNKSPWY